MAKHKKLTFLGAITVFSMFFSVATVPIFFIYDYGWVIYIYPIYFFTLIFFGFLATQLRIIINE